MNARCRHVSPGARRKGFTLLELIIATAVGVVYWRLMGLMH